MWRASERASSAGTVRATRAAAIDGEIPGDANEPDAEVADGGRFEVARFALVFEDAKEDILNDVFGLGWIAEDGVGDAVEQGGVGVDERGDGGLRCGRVLGGQGHGPSPFPVAARCHVCLSTWTDGRVGISFGNIFSAS